MGQRLGDLDGEKRCGTELTVTDLRPQLLLSCALLGMLACAGHPKVATQGQSLTPDGGGDRVQASAPPACAPGTTLCTGECRALQKDPNACGACERVCPEGFSCQQGRCECRGEGLVLCGGRCTDLTASYEHCGRCGLSCRQGQRCDMGRCQALAPAGSKPCFRNADCPGRLVCSNVGGGVPRPSANPQSCKTRSDCAIGDVDMRCVDGSCVPQGVCETCCRP
jgi:hypothetical protein